MAIVASRWNTVYEALLSLFNGASTLSSVTVSDGIPISEDRFNNLLIVGNIGDPTANQAGSISQQYAELAGVNSSRDETVTIDCCIIGQNGDSDLSSARSAAFTTLNAVETLLRNNYDLGLRDVVRTELRDASVYLDLFSDGAACRISFTIETTCLLTTV
jgi:hypothetical protein